jgi:Flp pilus assembly protein TadD
VFDDEPSIAHNPHLRSLWPLTRSMSAPPDTTLAGRPVASLTLAINHAMAQGGSLFGYHAANLAIHLATALLLFGLIRRTLLTPRLVDTISGSAAPLALAIAVLWVVHPLQTASVTYIVQRVESLMGLLYLATLYCAIRALDEHARGSWTAASVLACALGMGTKEVMVTAPLLVVLWDRQFAPDRTTSRRPLYGALAATWIILAALLAGAPRASSVGFGFEGWPWWRYLMTQAGVVAHYLRLSIVPAPLVLDYEWPATAKVAQVAMPGLVILVLLAATAWGLVRRLPAAFAGAWFFAILAPTSSVVPIVTEVAAEHRMYLPVAGVIALVVLGVFASGRRLVVTRSSRRMLAGAGLGAAAAVALLFAWLTYQRNADYHDYDRIWSDTIAKRPRNARARNNYATSLLAKGRFDEALPHLRVAVEANPAFAEAEANLGVTLSALGRLDEGIAHLQSAVLLRPDYAAAYRNLGEAYGLQRRLGDAAQQYSKALLYLPDDVDLLNRTAWILATTRDDRVRDGARAKALAERAVRLTSRRDAVSLDSLGVALAEVGEFEAAAAIAREALAVGRLKSDQTLASELEYRLRLYERGLRFRDLAG